MKLKSKIELDKVIFDFIVVIQIKDEVGEQYI